MNGETKTRMTRQKVEIPDQLTPIPQRTLTHLRQIKLITKKYSISCSCINFTNNKENYFIQGQAEMYTIKRSS